MGDLRCLGNTRIGIVGCGHLGQAIVRLLLGRGLHKQNLMISYGGNPLTYQTLASIGLADCLTSNENILRQADIIFLTIKPKDIAAFHQSPAPDEALLISCMAGISLDYLRRMFGTNACRIMLSGPDTLLKDAGLAAIYPQNERLTLVIEAMGLTILSIETEDDLNTFTAGVCLPAALVMQGVGEEQEQAIDRIGADYPLMRRFYEWALKVAPDFDNEEAKGVYIKKMMTKGGVTEAIIRSLENGAQLDAALRAGLGRIVQISEETEAFLRAQ